MPHERQSPVKAAANRYSAPTFWVLFGTLLAASAAASFTGYQAWIAGDTAKRQLRAYVGVHTVEVQCRDCTPPDTKFLAGTDKRNAAVVGIKNGGQTPAYNVTATMATRAPPYNSDMPADFDFPFDASRLTRNPSVIYPGGISYYDQELGEFDVQYARDKTANLMLYGRIDYRDIFGVERQTKFCVFYSRSEAGDFLVNCSRHNSSD